jgi:hypothetical protein
MPMKAEEIFQFGELEMDTRARTLRRQRAIVTLNFRAFDVLLYFVQNPGKVLTRDELLKNAWPDAVVDENSLAQSISVLRRALDEKPGDNSTVVTSVVLSLDGSQVAFVQNNPAVTQATLVLLKWAASSGTIASPDTLIAVSNAAYPTCTIPCMTTIPFSLDGVSLTMGDLLSSPFYDYTGDILYVGDGKGYLHKFTSVFLSKGMAFPAETIASGVWPALTSNNFALTNPVYDQDTGSIFVGSLFGTLKRVNTVVGGGAGPVDKTAQIDTAEVNFDGPLLDSTNGVLYLVVSQSAPITGQSGGVSALYTFPVNFLGGANGVQTVLSTDGPGTAIYLGAFDNQWFLGTAGHMYACASAASAGNNVPTLYQIPVSTKGVLGTVSTGPALSTASGSPVCSPVTAYFNPNNKSGGAHPAGTDLIFLSVTNFGQTAAPISCAVNTGCLMSFDVTSGATLSSSTPTVATAHEPGGTSGIIVDGSSASTGASQIYLNPLSSTACVTSGGTGGCAVQASQSTLN